MKRELSCLFLCLLFVLPPAFGASKDDNTPDLRTRVVHYWSDYKVNKDGSFTLTQNTAVKVLKKQAIEDAKQTSIDYSTSVQKAHVIAAYTLKADGRRIKVPKSNFQVDVEKGKDKDAPVFSDITTLTVVFPDVEVGDTLVFAYRLTASQPMFPNEFSTSNDFPRTRAYDDVRIQIDAPVSLWTQFQARHLKTVFDTTKNGRRLLEWTYANPHPIVSKRYDYSVFNMESEPGFEFSTFHNYAGIAAAYGVRAQPKAAPTARVRKLAARITKGDKTQRAIAKALYDWVARNITYAGNCIGLGAVVPHDTDFILDNRMGDCKDHATLLQALLAAKGIASTQALVNAGSSYQLPKVPLVSMVNHVINYIPSLHLYVDSTSNSTPFGMLPFRDYDKPVLLVDGYRGGTHTPRMAVGSNQETMKTVVTILPDGSVDGNVHVSLKGMFAASMRAAFRRMNKQAMDDVMKNMYRRIGYIASGTIEHEDASALLDTYRYGSKFHVAKLFNYPATGAFAIGPYIFNNAPIAGYIRNAMRYDEAAGKTACASGRTTEEYTFNLPKTMKVLAIPDDMKVSDGVVSYQASYRLKGNVLKVRRVIDDRTPGNICTRQSETRYRKFAQKVWPNLKAQVLYK